MMETNASRIHYKKSYELLIQMHTIHLVKYITKKKVLSDIPYGCIILESV